MNLITTQIIELLTPLADPHRAYAMEKYMKNQFPMLGIAANHWRVPLKAFLKKMPKPSANMLKFNALQLFELPEREFQYAGIEMLAHFHALLNEEDADFLSRLITTRSWWDSVDAISGQLVAPFFRRYPALITPITQNWMNSENIWLQRVCLIFQLTYKKQTHVDLLANYCLQLAHSNEFFIQKAIGWALRQYAKTDKVWVQHFVENHAFKPLSRREALKHCI